MKTCSGAAGVVDGTAHNSNTPQQGESRYLVFISDLRFRMFLINPIHVSIPLTTQGVFRLFLVCRKSDQSPESRDYSPPTRLHHRRQSESQSLFRLFSVDWTSAQINQTVSPPLRRPDRPAFAPHVPPVTARPAQTLHWTSLPCMGLR